MDREAILKLECIHCHSELGVDPYSYVCQECGHNLTFVFDYDHIRDRWTKADLQTETDRSIWRYLPLLPVNQRPERRGLTVGNTPLIPFPDAAVRYGMRELWIKDDTRLPSLSLKDRASALGIQHADEMGLDTIIAASTGNAGASLACLSAYHGKRAILCIPADAPPAKLVQIRQHGASLLPIEANYDTAFDLARDLAERRGYYCRNTGINPILAEGKKTAALEIAEQLDWEVPDRVLVPVGDGCIISGLYRGFEDLFKLGWIESIPQLVAVQAEGSAAIVNSLDHDDPIRSVSSNTIADSISVDLPRDGEKARMSIRQSGGFGITVTDEEILAAQQILAAEFGLFAEPAAVSVMAGLLRLQSEGRLESEEKLVLLITGSGLKDIPHAQAALPELQTLPPDLNELEAFLDR